MYNTDHAWPDVKYILHPHHTCKEQRNLIRHHAGKLRGVEYVRVWVFLMTVSWEVTHDVLYMWHVTPTHI